MRDPGDHHQPPPCSGLAVGRRLGRREEHEEQRCDDQIPAIQRKQRHEHIPDEHELPNRAQCTNDETAAPGPRLANGRYPPQ